MTLSKVVQLQAWSCLEQELLWDLQRSLPPPRFCDPHLWVSRYTLLVPQDQCLALKLFCLISLFLAVSASVHKDVCNMLSSCSISWGSVSSSNCSCREYWLHFWCRYYFLNLSRCWLQLIKWLRVVFNRTNSAVKTNIWVRLYYWWNSSEVLNQTICCSPLPRGFTDVVLSDCLSMLLHALSEYWLGG